MLAARAWMIVLGAGLVIGAAYLALPQAIGTAVYLTFGIVPGAGVLMGVLMHRPRRSRPWVLLGIGLLVLYVGHLLAHGLRGAGLDPAPAELAYLAGYPMGGAGLIMLWADRRHLRGAWVALLDALVAAVGVLVVVLALARPWADAANGGNEAWGGLMVALPGPILNVVMIVTLIRLVTMSGRWSIAERLLLTGVATISIADTTYSMLYLSVPYPAGTALDSLFVAAGGAIGASALHPSMTELRPRARVNPTISLQGLVILVASLLTIPVSAGITLVGGGEPAWPVYVAALPIMLILVMARVTAMSRAMGRSERRFRSIINRSRDAFTIIGTDGTVQWRSENVGAAPDAIQVGESVFERVHPEDRPHALAALQSIISGASSEVTLEVRLVAPDGETWWVEASARNLIDDPGVRGVVVAYHDITDRRRTLAELEESESRLSAVFENASVGIALIDPNLRVVEVNPTLSSIVGRTDAELVGRSWTDVVHPDDRAEAGEMIWQAWTGERHDPTLTVRLQRSDGTDAWARLSISRIQRAVDVSPLVVAVVQDVTAEHEATERLTRQQRQRTEIVASIQRLRPAATPEETADAFCAELQRLPEINVAAVYEIRRDGTMVALAMSAPEGAPVAAGETLPQRRAAYLHRRLKKGPWVEEWHARSADGRYGRRWQEVGLKAAAYAPFFSPSGEMVGMVVTGFVEPPTAIDDQLHVITEFATVGSALLGGDIERRRSDDEARAELQKIIDERRFHAVFQPIVELRNSRVVGYEALTRFDDGVSPEARFGTADRVGLGRALERVTLEAALAAQRRLPPGPWLGINVSPALLLEPDLQRTLREGVERALILEVTEHVAVENYDELREALARFEGSVRLAVDDAGAGFASLQHIIELHPEIVKLHSGLVRDIQRDPVRQALVTGMRYFAESTGCSLLAEGVEQAAEARTLRRLGVDLGQGYLFGRPAEATPQPALTAVS